MFSVVPFSTYETWRPGRLFMGYLAMIGNLRSLNNSDFGELEKVTKALMNKPLPEKIRFCKTLVCLNHRSLFYKNFIELNSE